MVSQLEGNLIEAGALLSPETVAGEPIGRRTELERLRTCLAPMLRGEQPLSCWLYGPPGSGKTTLALWTIESIRGGAASRVGVYVNCWQHRTLHSVLQAIVDELKILGAEAQDTNVKFDRVRQAFRERTAVIILDDIDRPMPAQRDEIIGGLLNLPKVGVICIGQGTGALATTDDQIRSRLSPVVIDLPAYSLRELEEILVDRARRALAPDSWSHPTLRRIAAACGGDARLAIQMLRQAAAAAEMSGNAKLDPHAVEPALRQWQIIRDEARLAGLSEHERIIQALARQHTPVGTTRLARLYVGYCQGHDIRPMARRTFTKYLGRLASSGTLTVAVSASPHGGRLVRCP